MHLNAPLRIFQSAQPRRSFKNDFCESHLTNISEAKVMISKVSNLETRA